MSAHRTMTGDLTLLAGSYLKSADANAAINPGGNSRGCSISMVRRRRDSLSPCQGRAPYRYLVGVHCRLAYPALILQAIKCGLAQGLVGLPTVEELAARSEVVAESAVTVPPVLFSQIGNPNTFVVPLNEF
jgi:hypothetical protein